MKLSLLSLVSTAFAAAVSVSHRETQLEAAVHVRELIAYRAYGLGVLMSRFPADAPDVAGLPYGLQEYYARYPSLNDTAADLLFLAMPITTVFRNALPPRDGSMTMTISDLYGLGTGNLAAGRQRIALFGKIERVTDDEEIERCRKAYLAEHPDSRGWANGDGPHYTFFVRFRVEKIYALNGFGNVAYIGWIPLELYESSGAAMRTRKAVHHHWPVPNQPELEIEDLFGPQEIGVPHPFVVQA